MKKVTKKKVVIDKERGAEKGADKRSEKATDKFSKKKKK